MYVSKSTPHRPDDMKPHSKANPGALSTIPDNHLSPKVHRHRLYPPSRKHKQTHRKGTTGVARRLELSHDQGKGHNAARDKTAHHVVLVGRAVDRGGRGGRGRGRAMRRGVGVGGGRRRADAGGGGRERGGHRRNAGDGREGRVGRGARLGGINGGGSAAARGKALRRLGDGGRRDVAARNHRGLGNGIAGGSSSDGDCDGLGLDVRDGGRCSLARDESLSVLSAGHAVADGGGETEECGSSRDQGTVEHHLGGLR